MIIKILSPRFRSKIALIDYDWTIVSPKYGVFPKNVDDWKWLRPNVPDIIRELYKKGYGIYIVTNQTKAWKKDQIINVMEQLEIPLTICIAYEKSTHKPNRFIYDEAISLDKHKKVKVTESFMCGDALGRLNDHSDSDLKFAEAIGIKCLSPEELFPIIIKKNNMLKPLKSQEVIIMVGYPGSGKDTLISKVFSEYFIANGDDLKTSVKMIKAAINPIKSGQSIVFNATNPSKIKRAEYVKFANEYKIPIRCVHVNTSIEDSLASNNTREKPVPRIVYNIYKKKFEEPDVDEGFTVITV